MPPKRKQVPGSDEESDSDYEEESPVASEGSDYEEEAPKKKPASRKAPAKKKTTAAADEAGRSGSKSKSAGKAAPRKKVMPPTAVTNLPDGWTLHPPSFIYKLNPQAQGGTKIAAFDLDGTLVGVKSGRPFPTGPDDWKWYNKSVPGKLRELYKDGYQIVIFSNQGSVKSAISGKASDNLRHRVDGMVSALNKKAKEVEVPLQVFLATMADQYRKPEQGMWEFFVRHANAGVQPDLSQSFYCGDAAGRPTDISDGASSDKDFAAAIGLPFFTPEDKFGEGDIKHVVKTGDSTGLNSAMAEAFHQLAALFKAEPFKANAFKKVGDIIAAHPTIIKSAKDLASVAGVGKSSLAKITEFLETGTIAALQEAGIEVGAAAPVDKAAEVGLKFL